MIQDNVLFKNATPFTSPLWFATMQWNTLLTWSIKTLPLWASNLISYFSQQNCAFACDRLSSKGLASKVNCKSFDTYTKWFKKIKMKQKLTIM
jgi:hypothetical protein